MTRPLPDGGAARALLAVALALAMSVASVEAAGRESIEAVEEACDVIVAGGSLASLAAALSAANASASASVCFVELTDEPGGQLTASAVPAIDFGRVGNYTNQVISDGTRAPRQ